LPRIIELREFTISYNPIVATPPTVSCQYYSFTGPQEIESGSTEVPPPPSHQIHTNNISIYIFKKKNNNNKKCISPEN